MRLQIIFWFIGYICSLYSEPMRNKISLTFLVFSCMTWYIEASCYSCPDHSTSTAHIGELECQFLTYTSFISLFCTCQSGYTGPIFFSDVDVQCVSLNLTSVISETNSTSVISESNSTSVPIDVTSTSPCSVLGLDSVDLDEFLLSHAPGLYVCALLGIVGSILNFISNFILYVWIGNLRIVKTNSDVYCSSI